MQTGKRRGRPAEADRGKIKSVRLDLCVSPKEVSKFGTKQDMYKSLYKYIANKKTIKKTE